MHTNSTSDVGKSNRTDESVGVGAAISCITHEVRIRAKDIRRKCGRNSAIGPRFGIAGGLANGTLNTRAL